MESALIQGQRCSRQHCSRSYCNVTHKVLNHQAYLTVKQDLQHFSLPSLSIKFKIFGILAGSYTHLQVCKKSTYIGIYLENLKKLKQYSIFHLEDSGVFQPHCMLTSMTNARYGKFWGTIYISTVDMQERYIPCSEDK